MASRVPEDAGAAFVVTGDDALNADLARRLRKLRPDLLILTEALASAPASRLRAAGADFVLESKGFLASALIGQITVLEKQRAARRLVAEIRPCRRRGLAIFLHDNPDPDCIASALALLRICAESRVPCCLYYGGEIAHPENRLMVSTLDAPLVQVKTPAEAAQMARRHRKTALVESSIPGQNNILPRGSRVDIVIDHHPLPPNVTPDAALADIRPELGAAATILTGYLQRLQIRPDPPLASALLYAIKVDTNDYTRNVDSEDLRATVFLSELADMRLMRSFGAPPMPGTTAELLARAIEDREVFRGHLLSCAGSIRDRDALAEAAEFLVRLEGVEAAVVFGILRGEVFISARSNDPSVDVGRLRRAAFGRAGSAGGHPSSAGARIPLEVLGRAPTDEERAELARRAVRRLYLRAARIPYEG
jgi:nanoRNase/pAp phosphatase (c-di-AMP/oligoRNAs hydrolase)